MGPSQLEPSTHEGQIRTADKVTVGISLTLIGLVSWGRSRVRCRAHKNATADLRRE
jgi:hypothetical protein